MERLSDRIEELEAELDDQRVDFEKDMAEAIAAAKQSVEAHPADRSAETTSCKTTCPARSFGADRCWIRPQRWKSPQATLC